MVVLHDSLGADNIAYGGVGFAGVDVVLHLGLIAGEGSLDGRAVDVLHQPGREVGNSLGKIGVPSACALGR